MERLAEHLGHERLRQVPFAGPEHRGARRLQRANCHARSAAARWRLGGVQC
jgi:hypothetical protein